MSLTIRRATVKDLEDLHQIEQECFVQESFSRQQLKSFLGSSNFVNLVAIVNGKIVGFIMGSIETIRGETRGHIYTIDVKREYRRRGIGFKLLNALERIFSEKDVEICYLEVREDNTAAKGLYMKSGYKISETIRDYYGLGINGIRLKKDLKAIKKHSHNAEPPDNKH